MRCDEKRDAAAVGSSAEEERLMANDWRLAMALPLASAKMCVAF